VASLRRMEGLWKVNGAMAGATGAGVG